MSTESAARPGRFHEVGFYHSDAEFGALIVPFVEGGVAAGQPVIIGYDDRKAGLLRSWLYDPAAVNFIADARLYATPARAIASYWKMFEEYTDAGATQIRIAGDVPHEGNGGRFAGWDRYECAANTVWGQFPVWSRCLYDATTAASRVLDIAARTHPRIVLPSGQFRDSGLYQDPGDFRPLPSDPHPLERSAPALEMTDPLPAQARRAVTSIGHGQVPGTVLQDLEIGVTEAIGHARLHGHPPVTARIWAASGRIMVHVHDTSSGPGDPLAGLVPAWADPRFRGAELWLIHMLDLDTALIRSGDGFTVQLAAGPATLPPGNASTTPAGTHRTVPERPATRATQTGPSAARRLRPVTEHGLTPAGTPAALGRGGRLPPGSQSLRGDRPTLGRTPGRCWSAPDPIGSNDRGHREGQPHH
jgi:hypothetical protein